MTGSDVEARRAHPAPPARSAMPAERWRAVDSILQSALDYRGDRRDAFVAGACRDDLALQREVLSLLGAHDAAPLDFLERPAFEEFGDAPASDAPSVSPLGDPPVPVGTPSLGTRRLVTAQALVYAATCALLVGLAGGWALAHPSWTGLWGRTAPAQSAADVPTVQATTGGTDGLSLVVVDRRGQRIGTIPADRPWTPRFSPDGGRVAYGAFGAGRNTSDLWVSRLEGGSARRLTDDDRDANDPQWSPDGSALAYSLGADGGKDVAERPTGDGTAHVVAARPGAQFPSDWRRDGSALLVTDEGDGTRHDIVVQPDDGSPARPYAATGADETSARFSADGKWVAYTSDESGRQEVYVDGYPTPGRRVQLSRDGGADPVWRADGKELYYWRGDDLVAVQLAPGAAGAPPIANRETVLFHAAYQHAIDAMYDATADGMKFVIVVRR